MGLREIIEQYRLSFPCIMRLTKIFTAHTNSLNFSYKYRQGPNVQVESTIVEDNAQFRQFSKEI